MVIALLKETYPREIARVCDLPLVSVQRIVRDLEAEDVLASRLIGGNRMVMLNPRSYGVDELRGFLLKYSKRNPDLNDRAAELRRRPRRTGKPI